MPGSVGFFPLETCRPAANTKTPMRDRTTNAIITIGWEFDPASRNSRPMKRWTCVVVLLLLLGAQALGEETRPTPDEFLKAVAAFEKDPFTPAVDAQLKTMVDFTEKSPDVHVRLTARSFPVATEKDTPDEVAAFLFGAFVGGNGREQVRQGRKGDQPYPGVKLMLSTYARLKARTKYRSAGLEKLEKLESEGKLKAYLKE